MRLNGRQLQQLQQILTDIFPSYKLLARIVLFNLDHQLSEISSELQPVSHVVFDLITWAQQRGILNDLIQGVLEYAPNHPDLQKFVAAWDTHSRDQAATQAEAQSKYLQTIIEKYEGELGGAYGGKDLSSIYVEPHLTPTFVPREEMLDRQLPPQRSSLDTLLTYNIREEYKNLSNDKDISSSFPRLLASVLDETRRTILVITGDAGIGKTTLLKTIAVRCAQKGQQLPIFINLAEYAYELQAGKNLVQYIIDELQLEFPHITADDVQTGLQRRDYLLLLDGLDEISVPRLRQDVIKSIQQLVRRSSASILITSRSASYHDEFNYDTRELLPLSVPQIKEYIQHWFMPEQQDRAALLLDQITVNLRLRQMLSNPLILYMMVKQLSTTRLGSPFVIPDRRVELYQLFIKSLIIDRPELRHQFLPDNAPDLLATPELQRTYFDKIGDMLHTQGFWYASKLKMIDTIKQVAPALDSDKAAQHLKYLLQETGLLQITTSGNYAFSHFTFQEFFAAEYLSQLSTPQDVVTSLVDHSMDLWWHEVIVIYCSLTHNKQLLQKLASIHDNIFLTRTLLLVDCIAAIPEAVSDSYRQPLFARLVSAYRHDHYVNLKHRIFPAIERLGGQELLNFLSAELQQPDKDRLRRAIKALERLGTHDAREILLLLYMRRNVPQEIIPTLTSALITIDATIAKNILIDTITAYPWLASTIIYQIIEGKSPGTSRMLIELSSDPFISSSLQDQIIIQLAYSGLPEIQNVIIEQLHSVRDDPQRSAALLEALPFPVDYSLLEYVNTMLKSGVPVAVRAAARFLGRHRLISAIDTLFDLLFVHADDRDIQQDLLAALGAMRNPAAEEIVILHIDASPLSSIWYTGVHILGQHGSEASFRYLIAQYRKLALSWDSTAEPLSSVIQALHKINFPAKPVLPSDICQHILQYIQAHPVTDEQLAEAVTISLLDTISTDVSEFLKVVRQQPPLGMATINYWLNHSYPERLRGPIGDFIDQVLDQTEDLEWLRATLQLKLKMLAATPLRRREVLYKALTSDRSVLCLAALDEARLRFGPNDDLLQQELEHLLRRQNSLVVEQVIKVLGELGNEQVIDSLIPLLSNLRYRRTAFEALFDIARRTNTLHLERFVMRW